MKRILKILFVLVLALGGAGWFFRDQAVAILTPHAPQLADVIATFGKGPAKPVAQAARGVPAVPVVVAQAERKDVPVAFDAVGTVQAITSLPIRPRIDSQITEVHVKEGAAVKEGDLLFALDSRTIQAQLAQADAQISRDQAQLVQTKRDLARIEGLVAQKVTTEVARDTQITAVKVAEATLAADTANRDNLATQLSFTEIRSPVTGRIGSIPAKVGAIVRQADTTPLATVNQFDPIFVVFALPQSRLGELQNAMRAGEAVIDVKTSRGVAHGTVAFIENNVDTTTGTINVKARVDNGDEALWPGSFVPVRIVMSMEANVIAVPAAAIQLGQSGPYVFVVDGNNKARVRKVNVTRTVDGVSVLSEGAQPGERVVVGGVLRLVDGASVSLKDERSADETPAPPAKNSAS